MKRYLSLIAVAMLSGCAPLNERPSLDYPPRPLVYEDRATHTFFYVETDRRHVSAVRDGKILWMRDMTAWTPNDPHDQVENLGKIESIGGRDSNLIGVRFNTGEFGSFKMSNGDFRDEGCD